MKRLYEESPATFAICAAWILIFLAMLLSQGGLVGGGLLRGSATTATWYRFGAQTAEAIARGEIWRAITASMIHFNLFHIFVNLVGMYRLGPVLESWYGSAQFLAVYVVIAFLGNITAALSKLALSQAFPGVSAFRDVPSGGGSVVLLGMIGLLAVVGWRSRTRFGDYIRMQMVGILAFTALLGALIPELDNFGHAGGALAGALVGFSHKWLVRNEERKGLRWAGWMAILALFAAEGAQAWSVSRGSDQRLASARDPRRERLIELNQALSHLGQIDLAYRELARRGSSKPLPYDAATGEPVGPSTAALRAALMNRAGGRALVEAGLDQGPTADAFKQMKSLAVTANQQSPTPGELISFQNTMRPLIQRILAEAVPLKIALGDFKVGPAQGKAPNAAATGPGKRPEPEKPNDDDQLKAEIQKQ